MIIIMIQVLRYKYLAAYYLYVLLVLVVIILQIIIIIIIIIIISYMDMLSECVDHAIMLRCCCVLQLLLIR